MTTDFEEAELEGEHPAKRHEKPASSSKLKKRFNPFRVVISF